MEIAWRKRTAKAPKFIWSVPLITLLLSVASFIAGTVLRPIYERLTFTGLSFAADTRLFVLQTSDGTAIVRHVVDLRIANVTKAAVAVEAIAPDMRSYFTGIKTRNLQTRVARAGAFGMHSPMLSQLGVTLGESTSIGPNANEPIDLPLIVKAESMTRLTLLHQFESDGNLATPTEKHKFPIGIKSIEELWGWGRLNPARILVKVNGKFRDVELKLVEKP